MGDPLCVCEDGLLGGTIENIPVISPDCGHGKEGEIAEEFLIGRDTAGTTGNHLSGGTFP
jgi:hypothetical protein